MFKLSPEAARAAAGVPAAGAPVAGAPVTFTYDGQPLRAARTDTVAAALFLHGIDDCRDTPVAGVARGPFCLMGVCYDCLVTIDGVANQQACMTRVREGMTVTRQHGAREVIAGQPSAGKAEAQTALQPNDQAEVQS